MIIDANLLTSLELYKNSTIIMPQRLTDIRTLLDSKQKAYTTAGTNYLDAIQNNQDTKILKTILDDAFNDWRETICPTTPNI
jgi:hypothetical protein